MLQSWIIISEIFNSFAGEAKNAKENEALQSTKYLAD